MDVNHLYLTADGRIGRQTYWLAAIALGVISVIVLLLLQWILGANTTALMVITIIWQILIAYPAYNLMAKRFHDRNKPSTYALYAIIAIVVLSIISLFLQPPIGEMPGALSMIVSVITLIIGIWLLIELGFLRGTVGPNTYGPDPVAP